MTIGGTGEAETVTVRIPFQIRKRGGRKLVLAPDGQPALTVSHRVDNVMVKALARAFRWRRMLKDGTHRTIEELAAAEGINESFVSRILRLTLRAPDLVSSILDGTQAGTLSLAAMMKPFPTGWNEQRATFIGPGLTIEPQDHCV